MHSLELPSHPLFPYDPHRLVQLSGSMSEASFPQWTTVNAETHHREEDRGEVAGELSTEQDIYTKPPTQ